MKLTDTEMKKLAQEAEAFGFSHAGPVDVTTLAPSQQVRDMCADGKCQYYGHNWMCPPECGTVEECAGKIGRYESALLVQVTAEMEDEFDAEAIMDAGLRLKELSAKFHEKMKERFGETMLLGVGACNLCASCAYPKPCRFPDKAVSAMEGYGLMITEVCSENGIGYFYGDGTITFHALLLF